MIKTEALRRRERRQALLTVVFTIISVIYLMPVLLVLINSLKANAFVNTETFKLPTAGSFVGLKNYVKGMTFGNFAFYKVVFYSFFITITSTALILLCTSMAAWYISRVGSLVSKIVYYLCVFSMVVPFQMVMYTLARTADRVHLNTPWTIPVVYLLWRGPCRVYVHGLCQESAAGDRGGRRHRRLRPGGHLLPGGAAHAEAHHDLRGRAGDHVGMERLSAASLVLDINQYRTIPIHIQSPQGQLRHRGHGRTMA